MDNGEKSAARVRHFIPINFWTCCDDFIHSLPSRYVRMAAQMHFAAIDQSDEWHLSQWTMSKTRYSHSLAVEPVITVKYYKYSLALAQTTTCRRQLRCSGTQITDWLIVNISNSFVAYVTINSMQRCSVEAHNTTVNWSSRCVCSLKWHPHCVGSAMPMPFRIDSSLCEREEFSVSALASRRLTTCQFGNCRTIDGAVSTRADVDQTMFIIIIITNLLEKIYVPKMRTHRNRIYQFKVGFIPCYGRQYFASPSASASSVNGKSSTHPVCSDISITKRT